MTFEFKEFESLKKTFNDDWDVIRRNEQINKADIEVEFKLIDATINDIEQKIKNLKKSSPEYIENMEKMYATVLLVINHLEVHQPKLNKNVLKCLNNTLGITEQKKPQPQELLNWQRKLNQLFNCSFIENNPLKGFKDQHTYSHIDKNRLIEFYKLNYVMQEKLFAKIELSLDKTCEYSSSFQSIESPKEFKTTYTSFEDFEKAINTSINTIIAKKNKLHWYELDRKEQVGLIKDIINILKSLPVTNKGSKSKSSMFESDQIVTLLGLSYIIRGGINIEYKKDILSKESTKTFRFLNLGGSELHHELTMCLGIEENFEEIDYCVSRAKNFLNYLLITPGKDGASDSIKLDRKLFEHINISFPEPKSEKSGEHDNKSVSNPKSDPISFIKSIMNLANHMTTHIRSIALDNAVNVKQTKQIESDKVKENNNVMDVPEPKSNPVQTTYHTPSNSEEEPETATLRV
ncbi:MAG TPA: hypothetical protein PK657_14510 [Legionella sp.]|nr:hypothetical protein [Legionella sp.]